MIDQAQRRGVVASRCVTTLAGLTVLLAASSLARNGAGLDQQSVVVGGLLLLVMIGGEALRLGGMRSGGISPVANAGAIAMALAFAREDSHLSYGWEPVVLTAALGMLLGVTVTAWVRQAQVTPSGYAVRLLVVAAVAWVFRELQLSDGRTMLSNAQAWQHERWRTVVVMLGLLAVALALEVALHLVLRLLRHGTDLQAWAREDVAENVPVSMAASSTAVALSLGLGVLGLWSIPLYLMPLLIMRFAIHYRKRTQLARRQTTAALSRLTDVGGYTRDGHAGRVADLCAEVGRELRLGEEERGDLDSAALLHDIGQVSLVDPIPGGSTTDVAPRDQERIARSGADIVRSSLRQERVAAIIEQQALPYRHVRELGEHQLLEARVLKVCNAFDDLGGADPGRDDLATERLLLGLGYEYDPRVVNALLSVLAVRR